MRSKSRHNNANIKEKEDWSLFSQYRQHDLFISVGKVIRKLLFKKGTTIKNQEILNIINEFSESLSLSDKKTLIVEAALDSLAENLGTDCSWVQLFNPVSNELNLVSSRNFTGEIQNKITSMDVNHYCCKQIVGLGNKIVIPDLSMDGRFGMSVFEREGFYTLIAVPITTYRVLGIMGAAYRVKNKISDDFIHLFSVIANLTAMALNKSIIAEKMGIPENKLPISIEHNMRTNNKERVTKEIPVIGNKTGKNSGTRSKDKRETFNKHVCKMGSFRKSHK